MTLRLNQQTDNSPLVAFRIMFGFILLWQAAKHIMYGWIENLLVQPKFTFSFIWIEWLQPLHGKGMYWYYGAMCVLSVLIIIGYGYRLATGGFAILWAGAYLMQKTVYNNHHYLLILMCFLMLLMPANACASLDSRIKPSIKSHSMPAWCRYALLLQIGIVYFYAAVAKLYPGWMDGTFTGTLLNPLATGYTPFFREKWFHIAFAWTGFLFDLFIVPLLLYRKTRTAALVAAIVFHTFNWATLNIGVFPLFSLTMLVFFYPPDTIRRLFFRSRPPFVTEEEKLPAKSDRTIYYVLVPYFIIQVFLPLRHHFIEGDVLYTEEGHRMSWRMMLKKKRGGTDFYVTNLATGKKTVFDKYSLLTKKQASALNGKPDMIWQMAQRIKKEYAKKGISVAVHAGAWVSINNGPKQMLIDPGTDLATAEWDHFSHSKWILSP
ncbi:HTTM domain-containing protein [uncultured Flavobacterium sp.]|uniref:HTTM domain-containing protein n=1 Tax=uncultured Flavobacterium sp. TaxID=165435 RepID=UPI0025CDA001|nr:HTTM domain-containing protein [uncultured Flavobacterium sp.]